MRSRRLRHHQSLLVVSSGSDEEPADREARNQHRDRKTNHDRDDDRHRNDFVAATSCEGNIAMPTDAGAFTFVQRAAGKNAVIPTPKACPAQTEDNPRPQQPSSPIHAFTQTDPPPQRRKRLLETESTSPSLQSAAERRDTGRRKFAVILRVRIGRTRRATIGRPRHFLFRGEGRMTQVAALGGNP